MEEESMSTPEIIVTACLAVLGLAHSALGESELLKPLFAAEWKIDTPRWAAERIFRFAWHLTSIAWFALAGIAAGLDHLQLIGMMSMVSAAIIFVMLRGHLAWPLFLLAGLAAFHAEGWMGTGFLQAGAGITVLALAGLAALHGYWALGGPWMLDRAVPQVESGFSPGPLLTVAVAGALGAFAALVAMAGFGDPPRVIRWLVMTGVAVLTLRAIGDNKVAGFTKQDHESPFGQADDQWFTPLVVFLALGATGALI